MKDTKEEMKKHSRYPYTYAYDLIRTSIPYGENGCKISRGDCAQMCKILSKVLGVENEDLCKKLADYYIENEEEISKAASENFIKCRYPQVY